jgi:hypothetical protein
MHTQLASQHFAKSFRLLGFLMFAVIQSGKLLVFGFPFGWVGSVCPLCSSSPFGRWGASKSSLLDPLRVWTSGEAGDASSFRVT